MARYTPEEREILPESDGSHDAKPHGRQRFTGIVGVADVHD